MLAKNKEQSRQLSAQIQNKDVNKEYVCRVLGEFPESTEEIVCDQPLGVASHKLGLHAVMPSGKDSKTGFRRLSFNGRTTVVLCKPYTGRTHQIRVHAQFLGFPIVNDPLYCHPFFGTTLGKGGLKLEERMAVVDRFMLVRPLLDEDAIVPPEYRSAGETPGGKEKDDGNQDTVPVVGQVVDKAKLSVGEQKPRRDPQPHELCLWLHAFKYSA